MDNPNYELLYTVSLVIGWEASTVYHGIKEKIRQRRLEHIAAEEERIRTGVEKMIFMDKVIHA